MGDRATNAARLLAENGHATPELVEILSAEVDRWLAEVRREAAEKAAVEVGVCEHQNANYLRMMSERADAAEAEVERLWAGIEALADTKPGATGRALRDLLAGSGEQPGEVDGYCTCHDDQKGRTRDCGVKVHREAGRPAPPVPDSADVRERIDRAVDENLRPYIDGTGAEAGVQNLITDILAVVGQGVTAKQARTEAERRYGTVGGDHVPYLRRAFRDGAAWASAVVRSDEQEETR